MAENKLKRFWRNIFLKKLEWQLYPEMQSEKQEERIAEAVIGLLLLKGGHLRDDIRTRNEKTAKELEFLEDIFEITSYPDCSTKKTLSLILGMSQKTIQIWFQNKRRCLKAASSKEALAEKSNFTSFKLSKGQLQKRSFANTKIFTQKSISPANILEIYCKNFGIAWDFS